MIAAAGAAHTDRKAPHWLTAGAVAVLAITAADYALDRRVDPAEPQARLAPAELRAGIRLCSQDSSLLFGGVSEQPVQSKDRSWRVSIRWRTAGC